MNAQRPPYEVFRRHWSSLIRPRELAVVEESPTRARFHCEPLERGFGDTLGVALRRALLTAIPGAAVTAVRVTPVPSVDWMTELCLNLSQLCVDAAEPMTIEVEVASGKIARAAMLEPSGLRVLNPELPLFTADHAVTLELWVERGHGLRTAASAKEIPGGAWPVSACFAPVRRAEYVVERARVGNQVDFDRLRLDVETNGALSPRQALSQAARTLSSHFALFLNFEERPEPNEQPTEAASPPTDHLFTAVADLELSVRTTNCLRAAQVEWIGDLVQLTEAQLMNTRNFGVKSLGEIQTLLGERGLSLGMSLPDWREQLEQRRSQTAGSAHDANA